MRCVSTVTAHQCEAGHDLWSEGCRVQHSCLSVQTTPREPLLGRRLALVVSLSDVKLTLVKRQREAWMSTLLRSISSVALLWTPEVTYSLPESWGLPRKCSVSPGSFETPHVEKSTAAMRSLYLRWWSLKYPTVHVTITLYSVWEAST